MKLKMTISPMLGGLYELVAAFEFSPLFRR